MRGLLCGDSTSAPYKPHFYIYTTLGSFLPFGLELLRTTIDGLRQRLETRPLTTGPISYGVTAGSKVQC